MSEKLKYILIFTFLPLLCCAKKRKNYLLSQIIIRRTQAYTHPTERTHVRAEEPRDNDGRCRRVRVERIIFTNGVRAKRDEEKSAHKDIQS